MSQNNSSAVRTATTTDSAGTLEWFLVSVGFVPMAVERYLPSLIRRSFGARIFLLAAVSIVVAPGLAVVLFSDVLVAAIFISSIIAVSGFLGYCEMYRALREINGRVNRIDDGEFDITFRWNRIDEIGETYSTLEQMAQSLGESIERAERETEKAKRAQQEAEDARKQAESERERAEQLSEHLEEKAAAFSTTMQRAADGDLSQRMDPDGESEAMAQIAEEFNAMMAELAGTLSDVRSFADDVAESSQQVTTVTGRTRETSEEVSEAVERIAANAKTQSENLTQVSAEMQDLSGTVEEVASSTDAVASTTEQAAELGRSGRESASTAMTEMEQIDARVDRAIGRVESLAVDIDEISEITQLITDIAEQTNMLALNASIEAARAGEAGEGFAVVADEIKGLASEVEEATTEAEQLVEGIQASATEAVDDMRETGERVDSGRTTIEDALDALQSIAEAVEETNDSVQEISAATSQQATTTEEVVSIVDEVAATAETISTESTDASQITQDQTAAMTEVSENASTVSSRAEELQNRLSAFTLDGAPSQTVTTPQN